MKFKIGDWITFEHIDDDIVSFNKIVEIDFDYYYVEVYHKNSTKLYKGYFLRNDKIKLIPDVILNKFLIGLL
jgi:hypothetical protein